MTKHSKLKKVTSYPIEKPKLGDPLPLLDTFELEGFKTVNNYLRGGLPFKVSLDENWMIDFSPFSNKYRLVPTHNDDDAYDKFLLYPDIFLKNEDKDVNKLLKLYNELLSN